METLEKGYAMESKSFSLRNVLCTYTCFLCNSTYCLIPAFFFFFIGGSILCTLLYLGIFQLCNFGDFPEQKVEINIISKAAWYFRYGFNHPLSIYI